MTRRSQAESSKSSQPAIGTLVDGNSLKLVEILGVGGYGVVYRAIDTYSSHPRSYAVKCLSAVHGQSAARRQMHIREISFHQIASTHPSVVTLHRVVEESGHTFIIMDYAPDHDLFTQILHKSRYLGDSALIKHTFLQIVDAVQYCHSLGIYHRDLKPENVLCFDQGYRVAITDFGLATTDKVSKEFRTGSLYHMSPECQSADSVSGAAYSPMHNDIWSLGIILLNLVTGRNPWKSATSDDPTYQAYRRSPMRFLPTVLPISKELNNILIQALAVDWRGRMSLLALREAVAAVNTFYSDDVVFDGNLAACPWEVGMDLGSGDKRPVPDTPQGVEAYCVASTSPTTNSRSPPTITDTTQDEDYDQDAQWDGKHSEYNLHQDESDYEGPAHSSYEYSGRSSPSSDPASPITPTNAFGDDSRACSFVNWDTYGIYDREEDNQNYGEERSTAYSHQMDSSFEGSDDFRYPSSNFVPIPIKETKPLPKRPEETYANGFRTAKRYSSPNTSIYSVAEASAFGDSDVEIGPPTSDGRRPRDPVPESPNSVVFVTWPPDGYRGTGQRAMDVPRSNPKPHPFDPRRFFPRSGGSSWLNTKGTLTSHLANVSRVQVVQEDPRAGPRTRRDDYHRAYVHQPPARNAHQQARASNRPIFHTQMRSSRDWLPGFFAPAQAGR